jgi:hypothetical protein
MTRRAVAVLVLVATSMLIGGPAAATSGWDPNDQPGRIDLRWAGAYRPDRDTVRLGIRVWDPVFRADVTPKHAIEVSMNPYAQDADAFIVPRPGGGWVARFYDDGVKPPLFHARVSHPSATLFRLWLPAHWAKGQPITVFGINQMGGRYLMDRIDVVAPGTIGAA